MDEQGQIQANDTSAVSTPRARRDTKQDPQKQLQEILDSSHEILVTATTVFPFTLFPDTITVDRNKITVTKRTFFMSSEAVSIRIEDVLNVTCSIGPIFGSIKIVSRVFNSQRPYAVRHFWRDDAVKIKHIAQGYVIALQRKIDCTSLEVNELRRMLSQLGHDAGP